MQRRTLEEADNSSIARQLVPERLCLVNADAGPLEILVRQGHDERLDIDHLLAVQGTPHVCLLDVGFLEDVFQGCFAIPRFRPSSGGNALAQLTG